MFSELANSIEQLQNVAENSKEVVKALQSLRTNTSDEDWDKLMENELLECLLDTCTDLESVVEDENAA